MTIDNGAAEAANDIALPEEPDLVEVSYEGKAVSVETADQPNGWFGEPVHGLLSLRYTDLIPLLVSALKEQVLINEEVKSRLDNLDAGCGLAG